MVQPGGRSPEDDRRIVVHEAGHALMAERMRMKVDIISADPDDSRRNGYCEYQVWGAPGEAAKSVHWRRCVVAWAGAMAESVIYGGDPNSILFHRRDDIRIFREVRDILNLPYSEWHQFCQEALTEAETGTDRCKIEFVADNLQACRQMTGDQFRALIGTA
jgi:hypothetical protein